MEYGTGAGQLSFVNATVEKELEEPAPFGPMAFRIHGGEAWVADSCNGRIFCLGADGKVKTTVSIPGIGSDAILADFALVPDKDRKITGIWVGDAQDSFVRHISVPDGKELAKFGGNGEGPGQFQQIQQIEISPGGKVYVGDFAKNKISVFDSTGKFLREQEWQSSGFVVNEKDRIFTVNFTDGKGFSLETLDPSGKSEKSISIGLPNCTNPRLWALDKEGNYWVSFIPAEGFQEKLDLYQFAPDGKQVSKNSFTPLGSMNRFLDFTSEGEKFLAEGDFDAAPKGNFVIRSF